MSRNAKARRIKTDPVGQAFFEDLDKRMKDAGVDRPERRRRVRALARGEVGPEESIRWIEKLEKSRKRVLLPRRKRGEQTTASGIVLPAGVADGRKR